MSPQATIAERLLTWLDVERLLKQATALWSLLPVGVYAIDCFADGMEILHAAEASRVEDWLTGLFGHAYDREQKAVRLRIGEAKYSVKLVKETSEPAATFGQTYPLWRDVTYLPTAAPPPPLGSKILNRQAQGHAQRLGRLVPTWCLSTRSRAELGARRH